MEKEHGIGLLSQEGVNLRKEGREYLALACEVCLLPLLVDIVLDVVNEVFESVSPGEHQLVDEEVLVVEGEGVEDGVGRTGLEQVVQVRRHLVVQESSVQDYLEQTME